MIAIDKGMLDYFYRTPIYYKPNADASPILYKPANTRMEDLRIDEERYPPLLFIMGDDQESGLFELRNKVSVVLQQDIVSGDPCRVKQSLAKVMDLALTNPGRASMEVANGAVELLVYEYGNNKQVLDKLVQVAIKDHKTAIHSINVLVLALRYAFFNDMSADQSRRLALAALLHDIGVADLEKDILRGDKPMDDAAYEEYRRHTDKGHKLLERCGVPEDIRNAALNHHERCDGSGYPRGAREVPEFAQIIGLIHDFESLVYLDRPWRPCIKPYKAMELLKSETLSGRFDQEIFKRFVNCLNQAA